MEIICPFCGTNHNHLKTVWKHSLDSRNRLTEHQNESVLLGFECEEGGHRFALDLRQHEGTTNMEAVVVNTQELNLKFLK
jgi:hypothetical protein